MASSSTPIEPSYALIKLGIDRATWGLTLEANIWLIAVAAVITATILYIVGKIRWRHVGELDLDEAELGIGSAKIKLKPNRLDRQVAYQIWVELSTRKIGLKIDLDHDVISDLYASWHAFFAVTRELIKTVPVNKVSDPSTKMIIDLSIDLLNIGLRPHLTKWQARFRAWFDRQLDAPDADEPQTIQKLYPRYTELTQDIISVNQRLMAYRRAMYQVVYGSAAAAREAVEEAADVVAEPTEG